MLKSLAIMVLVWVGLAGAMQAQSTLLDLVEEVGGSWLIGEWEATNENGEAMQQTFSWDLDKHVVMSLSKNPRWTIKGMTGMNPETGRPDFVGFSDRGGAVRGTWGEHEGSPELRIKAQDKQGQTWQGAVIYRKVDQATMEVKVFSLETSDEPSGDPISSLTYKRKK